MNDLTLGLTAVMMFSLSVCAQESGYQDLSRETANPLQYTKWQADPTCKQFGGGMGSVSGGVASPSLKLSLVEFENSRLKLGDSITAMLRIQNVGTEVVSLPWLADPELIESPNDKGQFQYFDLQFYLSVNQQDKSGTFFSPVKLYGSENVPGSLYQLKPGSWLQVRINVPLDCTQSLVRCNELAAGPGSVQVHMNESENTIRYLKCSTESGSRGIRRANSEAQMIDVEMLVAH